MPHFNSEYYQQQEPGFAERRLLLGIDAPLTAATKHALDTVGAFFAPSPAHLRLMLLNVIPVPYVGGKFAAPGPLPPTTEQRKQAEEALRQASAALQEFGMTHSHIQTLIRVGSPSDELVKVANQHHIDCLVIGRRSCSPWHWLRSVLMGSMSHYVLHHTSCPVIVVTLPRSKRPGDLVSWYETAIRQRLTDHPTMLLNVTSADVVWRFPFPHVSTAGREERAAATKALERLVTSGLLCRFTVQGKTHYIND